ncbi:MAG: hypothetical protein DMF64_04205 [Acidobacteria bacterium]|nr:MAG: hypothetical protein DMF64_04205 [Acidobacteriota bacterium]
MKSLSKQQQRDEVVARLRQLRPDSGRLWGRMSSHQMICHLSDSFRMAMGVRAAEPVGNPFQRTVLKWVALKTPLPWPKGYKTRPEADQEIGGTRPVEFARDMQELEALLARFTAEQKDFRWQQHPIFGALSEPEWMRWGYLHTDHHLRQFGL